jgi:hypothetical protein
MLWVGGPYHLRLEASTPRVCEAHWPGVDGAWGWRGSEKEVEHVSGGNMLIRRRALIRTGKFNESLQGWYDETELLFRHRRGASDMLLRERLRKNHSSVRLEARFFRTFGRPDERSDPSSVPVLLHVI